MVNYREILRLNSLKYTQTDISISLKTSRNTIREVIKMAKEKGISWPLEESVTNSVLEGLLYPEKSEKANVFCQPDYEYIHRELARPGVTMSLLHAEYLARCADAGQIGYQKTQFYDNYSTWARKTKATMRIHHKPGDAMEVDWAGNTLPITDSVTGETTDAYLFVAVLPCSCFAYAELCRNMRSENWLLCHAHAYEYFGGVPRLLIPDNLRTGVTKNTRLDTVINRSYLELAEHYQTAVVPARVEAPKDKSHAEGTVKYASTWILAALRDRVFFTFEEAFAAVAEKLESLNDAEFKKREGTRRLAYINEEKAFMHSLPVNAYEPAIWSDATVPTDYCVTDGLNRYWVPYDLIGEQVQSRVTRDTVEFFYHGNRVASHVRLHHRQPDPVVKTEHMPDSHKKYLSYNKDAFLEWAGTIGENTEKVIRTFLQEGRAPEQGYKSCRNLMKLCEKYGNEKLEEACRSMLTFSGTPNIRSLMQLLKTPIRQSTTSSPTSQGHSSRGITRGASQFRNGGAQ